MYQRNRVKEPTFPIAAGFSAFCTLLNLILTLLINRRYGSGLSFYSVYDFLAGAFLTTVLFMRKRDLLLFGAVGSKLVSALFSFCYACYWLIGIGGFRSLIIICLDMLQLINWSLLLAFAFFRDRQAASDVTRIFRKLWFVPGIFASIFALYTAIDANSFFLTYLFEIPLIFLLAWWLLNPYKVNKPAYAPRTNAQPYMAHAYGAPTPHAPAAPGKAPAAFCSACGAKLLPGAMFCSACGKRCATPSQDAQPAYQQAQHQSAAYERPAYQKTAYRPTEPQPPVNQQPDTQEAYTQPATQQTEYSQPEVEQLDTQPTDTQQSEVSTAEAQQPETEITADQQSETQTSDIQPAEEQQTDAELTDSQSNESQQTEYYQFDDPYDDPQPTTIQQSAQPYSYRNTNTQQSEYKQYDYQQQEYPKYDYGEPVYQQPAYRQGGYAQDQDVPSTGMNVLSFFLPGVGLILYLIWKDQFPIKAKAVGKHALIGVIVWVGLYILAMILAAVIPMLILGSMF